MRKKTTTPGIHLGRLRLYRGLQARVAEQLQVSEAFVSSVARGKKKSARVLHALEAEAHAVELQIAIQQQEKKVAR